MNTYIFTFGLGTKLKGMYQPIEATNEQKAREIMFSIYDENWASCYTEDYFNKCREDGLFKNLKALPTINNTYQEVL